MNQSAYPDQSSTDELKVMLRALADSQSKLSDKTVEILVRLKSQDEKITAQANLLTGFNQRLVAVEAKTERNARAQAELEGDVLREVGVQARKIDSLAAETERQSVTLASQDVKLEELIDDKKQVLAMLKTLRYLGIVGPIVLGALVWLIQHAH